MSGQQTNSGQQTKEQAVRAATRMLRNGVTAESVKMAWRMFWVATKDGSGLMTSRVDELIDEDFAE